MDVVESARCTLWICGINLYPKAGFKIRIISDLLFAFVIFINSLSIVNHWTRYQHFDFGEGVFIIVTIRPIISVGILLYLHKKSNEIIALIDLIDRDDLRNRWSRTRMKPLLRVLLIVFLSQPLRVLYLVTTPLPGAPKLWFDLFSLAKNHVLPKPYVTILYLIRVTLFDYVPILGSVFLYMSIYTTIQANYHVQINHHFISYESKLSTKFNDFIERRLTVNRLMMVFEQTLNLIPLLWMVFVFLFVSLELAFYTYINLNGLNVFVAYAMSRFLIFLVLTHAFIYTISICETEDKIIQNHQEYYARNISLDYVTLAEIDFGLHLAIDEPVKPTAFRLFSIQKGIFLHFIGSVVSFSLLFRSLFEFEFKKILYSIGSELNFTVISSNNWIKWQFYREQIKLLNTPNSFRRSRLFEWIREFIRFKIFFVIWSLLWSKFQFKIINELVNSIISLQIITFSQ